MHQMLHEENDIKWQSISIIEMTCVLHASEVGMCFELFGLELSRPPSFKNIREQTKQADKARKKMDEGHVDR